MTRTIKADYSETYLFPPSLEDWVGSDHPARFIREVVEALDLEELGLEEGSESEQGRPHYSGELLLKAWLYGYMNNLRSHRQLEKACRENLGLIWLLGRHEPDHNTLWRFWRRHREAIRRVFCQVVRIAWKSGVIGVVLHAVDGTKIQAQGSSRASRILNRCRLHRQLNRIDEYTREIEEEIARNNPESGRGEYRLPEKLQEQTQLREEIQKALVKLDAEDRDYLNEREPEARMMPCGEHKKLAYNAQVVVDDQSGMIVTEKVVPRAVDCDELVGLLEETDQTLGQVASDTVADKGYRTDEAIGKASERDYSVLVHLYQNESEKADRYHGSRFEYRKQEDCCICPRGEKLVFVGLQKSRHGWMDRRYRCQKWQDCPEATLCSSNSRGRQIRISPYREAVDDQRRKQSQKENKQKLRRRKVIVEPPFAHIKQNFGFRRWTFWGLEGVKSQWSMLCTAYNLKKLLQLWQEGNLSLAR